MPVKTITTAGTRVQLNTATSPALKYGKTLTIERDPANSGAYVFVGFQLPNGVGNTVSSTVFDAKLSAAVPSVSFGVGNEGDYVDSSLVWLDASTNGDKVSWFLGV